MNWGWTAGYKHARMDVAEWNIHLGSTACSGEGKTDASSICANGNRPTYTIEGIDLAQEQIEFDYAALVMSSDVSTNTVGTAPGCMSAGNDLECNNVFTKLGLDLASGSCANDDCDSQDWVTKGNK
jgi:uncharacterized repeat protein (TIGR04052 family)